MTSRGKKELQIPVSDEVSLPHLLEESEQKHSSLDSLILLLKYKFFILYFAAGVAILSIIGSLLLPVYYTGEAKILPPQQGQGIASAMMGELGQLGGLIGALGGKDLLKNPSDLYASILRSRTVSDDLIDRFSLMNAYKAKKRIDARRRLESLTDITVSKEGVISISVDDRDPRHAAAMANAYIDELEKLMKTLAVTDASKRRIFFEREAKAANDDLGTAEQALKQTQESTGIIQLDSQSKVMLETYAELRAQVAAKEVEIQAMRSFATPDNPDLIRTEQELAALRRQVARYEEGGNGAHPIGDVALEKVPAKALEYVRKLREVKYREALLTLLLKQYEIARIDEGRDAAIIQVLDKALPPERKSRPKRAIIVLCATFLALLLAIICSYAREALARARENPQYLARLQLLKFYFFRGRQMDPR